LLGGGAWAANKINSGDVADNSLKSVDLKNGKGVKGADVAPDSLTGGAIDESTLQNVDAAAIGGLQVREIDYDVPVDDEVPCQLVLSRGGLEISAACRSFGDALDVKATTTKDNAFLLVSAVSASQEDQTFGGIDKDFDSGGPPGDIDNMLPTAGATQPAPFTIRLQMGAWSWHNWLSTRILIRL
jgi:hypothetical protein